MRLLAIVIATSIPSAQAPAQQQARAAWGFDRSDLTPHPAVRFGVLKNGMRYALMRNASPPGALSVRLHVDAGSNVEGARQQGYMHLLEHLIFQETKNLPEGALQLMLSRDGLQRWSDFNAFTSFDETVYRLDLSRADRRARGTTLTVMREVSSMLSFSRRPVDGAKQVVRAEIKERDAVQDRIVAAQNAFFFPGSPIGQSSVASTDASVRRAKGAALQALYQLHYVPQRTTLVMVGDFDPAAAEAEIAARFSDWEGRPAADIRPPQYTAATNRGPEAQLFTDPAAETMVTIALAGPVGGNDAGRRRDAQFLEHLGNEMLGRRLTRIASTSDAPFLNANSAIYDHFSTGRLARIDMTAKDRDWRKALQAGHAALRRALDLGFSQAELGEQLAASMQALASAAAPKTSPQLADAIADAVGRGIVFTEPNDGSRTREYLAQVRLEDVNAAFRAAWANPGPLIFVSHNRPVPSAEAAILEALYSPGR